MSITTKFKFPVNLFTNKPDFTPLLHIAEVMDVFDSEEAGRIHVVIKGVDDKKAVGDKYGESSKIDYKLLEAFPLIPKMVQVIPKIGESVFIINQYLGKETHRYWLGPIISQIPKIKEEKYFGTANSALNDGSNIELGPGPSSFKSSYGVYPHLHDIVIRGRDNTDMIQKSNEILLRTGQHIKNKPLIFNKTNQGFIQIKSFVNLSNEEKPQNGSVVNVVGNRINLISHDGEPKFKTMTPLDQITDEEIINIIKTAHPLAFGDILLDFLLLVKDFARNHYHRQINMVADSDEVTHKKLMKYDMNLILSKNIRIN